MSARSGPLLPHLRAGRDRCVPARRDRELAEGAAAQGADPRPTQSSGNPPASRRHGEVRLKEGHRRADPPRGRAS